MASLAGKNKIVRDPVCGMEKSKDQMGFTSEFNDKTYYFCSEGDKKTFDADPRKWIFKEGGK